MKVNAILACDTKFGIGYKGDLPWPKSDLDMKWFQKNTSGGIVLMGRSTWESIGSKPLPKRINIVVTNKDISGPDLIMSGDMENVIERIREEQDQDRDLWIMGGAEVYEQAYKYCDNLFLTTFDQEYKCDKYISTALIDSFPSIDYLWKTDKGIKFQIKGRKVWKN